MLQVHIDALVALTTVFSGQEGKLSYTGYIPKLVHPLAGCAGCGINVYALVCIELESRVTDETDPIIGAVETTCSANLTQSYQGMHWL